MTELQNPPEATTKCHLSQAYNRHLAPGGAERRRLCSLVVSGGSAAAVAKSLEAKGAQVRVGMDFFFQDTRGKILGILFLWETNWNFKKKNPEAIRV